MKKGKIQIKTHLHAGIYKSSGGGQTVSLDKTYNIGPLNLMRAMRDLEEETASNRRGYGDIGMGRSWICIDGQDIDNRLLPGNTLASCREFLAAGYNDLVREEEALMLEIQSSRDLEAERAFEKFPCCGGDGSGWWHSETCYKRGTKTEPELEHCDEFFSEMDDEAKIENEFFAQAENQMIDLLDSGFTKKSRSGQTIIFARPVCGRQDLSGTIEVAREQLRQAGGER